MTTKKLWLDDMRPVPDEGWTLVKTAGMAIALLASGTYGEVALDHDLGPVEDFGDGYQVIKWLEEQVMTDPTFPAPIVHILTDNGGSRGAMVQAARNIEIVRQQRIGGT